MIQGAPSVVLMAGARQNDLTKAQFDGFPDRAVCRTLEQLLQTDTMREIAKFNKLKDIIQRSQFWIELGKNEDPDIDAVTLSMALGLIPT